MAEPMTRQQILDACPGDWNGTACDDCKAKAAAAPANVTPDRSAPEGLVEALAGAVCEACGHSAVGAHDGKDPGFCWERVGEDEAYCTCTASVAEALAPTVAQLIDAAVAQRTAHLVVEGERLREVVGRVEAVADEWEAAEEPPGEDYEGTSDGHMAFGEYLATWQHARDLRAALRAGCEGRDGAPEAAGADLRASQGVPGVKRPTEASAGAREAGER